MESGLSTVDSQLEHCAPTDNPTVGLLVVAHSVTGRRDVESRSINTIGLLTARTVKCYPIALPTGGFTILWGYR